MRISLQIIFFVSVCLLLISFNNLYVHAQSYGCVGCQPKDLQQALEKARASANNTNSSNPTPQTTKPTASESCSSKMSNEMHTVGSSLNQSKAIFLAENSSEFKSKIQGYTVSSPTVFTEWKLNPNTCSVTLTDVNVGFQLSSSGSYVKNLVITVDPTLSRILKVDGYVAPTFGSGLQNTTSISPLKQFKSGVSMIHIKCKDGYSLMIKAEDHSPACVKSDTSHILIERGWGYHAAWNK